MQNKPIVALIIGCLTQIPMLSYAQNQWVGYGSASTAERSHHRPVRPHIPPHGQHPHRPIYPPTAPVHPTMADRGHISMKSGINVQYQAPTTVYYNQQQYTWVNGDPRVASIHSSTQQMIPDWQRYGLPAPPTGMYWIFEHGRYVLVPNR